MCTVQRLFNRDLNAYTSCHFNSTPGTEPVLAANPGYCVGYPMRAKCSNMEPLKPYSPWEVLGTSSIVCDLVMTPHQSLVYGWGGPLSSEWRQCILYFPPTGVPCYFIVYVLCSNALYVKPECLHCAQTQTHKGNRVVFKPPKQRLQLHNDRQGSETVLKREGFKMSASAPFRKRKLTGSPRDRQCWLCISKPKQSLCPVCSSWGSHEHSSWDCAVDNTAIVIKESFDWESSR